MKTYNILKITTIFLSLALIGCVEKEDYTINGNIDIVVIDGRITNLAEEQVVTLNRSKAEPETGRYGSTPITKAKVEIVVDGTQVIALTEKDSIKGSYIVPKTFVGQVGHSYQLRFRLEDGTQYESIPEVMQPVSTIENVTVQFNPDIVADSDVNFKGAHEFYIDTKDPADQKNYYSWEWNLYEKQNWCKSCIQGIYSIYKILPGQYKFMKYYVSGTELFEDCFVPPPVLNNPEAPPYNRSYWVYDYNCRTHCWEIFHNLSLNLFDDQNTNGGRILARKVAKIPFYQREPCLVDIRQVSLTREAYSYYKLFQEQIQNGGGVADTPPTALRGNVSNVANNREVVVGYFSASAISSVRYWLDRRDTGDAIPPGLFFALNARETNPEPDPPYTGPRGEPAIQLWGAPIRVPTAVCVDNYNRTPNKPLGWRD